MTVCNNPDCKVETSNPKFCSRACAAVITNSTRKRSKKPRYCKHCGIEVVGRVTTCDSCNPKKRDWSLVTLEDLQVYAYQISSRVRELARTWYNGPNECFICGYNIHVEICHIKPIKEFTMDSLILEVNSPNNLVALCPNHHWEVDNGHYPLALLMRRKGSWTHAGSTPA